MLSSLRLHSFIAWRFSRGEKQQRFASFVSWFSTLGITLGVMALITVSSVMNGFEGQLKQRILNLVPHLTTAANVKVAALQSLPATPLIRSDVVLQSAKHLQVARLHGIDSQHTLEQAQLNSRMLVGDLTTLRQGQYGIILGIGLANALELRVGDSVRVMATERTVFSPIGELPAQRNFIVTGIFEFGAEVDQAYALADMHDVARLLRSSTESLSRWRYHLPDPFDIAPLAQTLTQNKVEFDDWRADFGPLFAAVKMEKRMMSVLFFLIIAVAAFNILSSLVMMVGEKQSDVAILQTLGLARERIISVFVIQGAVSGCIGALLGALMGIVLTLNINLVMSWFGLNLVAATGGAGLPVIIKLGQIALITLGAMLLSIVATVYPAWRASQVLPAEALRHE